MAATSVGVLDTWAAANLAGFYWLGRRHKISECRGVPRAEARLACVRFKRGAGRFGEVRRAADFPAGIAGYRGKLA